MPQMQFLTVKAFGIHYRYNMHERFIRFTSTVPPTGFHMYIGRDNNRRPFKEKKSAEVFCNIPQVIPQPTVMAIQNGTDVTDLTVMYRKPYAWAVGRAVFTRYDNGRTDFNCMADWRGRLLSVTNRQQPLSINCKYEDFCIQINPFCN